MSHPLLVLGLWSLLASPQHDAWSRLLAAWAPDPAPPGGMFKPYRSEGDEPDSSPLVTLLRSQRLVTHRGVISSVSPYDSTELHYRHVDMGGAHVITRGYSSMCGGSGWDGLVELLDVSGPVARVVAVQHDLYGDGGLRVERLGRGDEHSLIHEPYASRTRLDDRLQVFEREGDRLVDRVEGLIFTRGVYVWDVEGDGVKELIVTISPAMNTDDNELGLVRRGADGRWRLDDAPPPYDAVKALLHKRLRALSFAALGERYDYTPSRSDPLSHYTEAELRRLVGWLAARSAPLEHQLQLQLWLAWRALRVEVSWLRELGQLAAKLPESMHMLRWHMRREYSSHEVSSWSDWLEMNIEARHELDMRRLYKEGIYIPSLTTHVLHALTRRDDPKLRAWATAQLIAQWHDATLDHSNSSYTLEVSSLGLPIFSERQQTYIRKLEIADALGGLRDPALRSLYEEMWEGAGRLGLDEPLATAILELSSPSFVEDYVLSRADIRLGYGPWDIFDEAPARACRLKPSGWDLRAYCDPARVAAALDRDSLYKDYRRLRGIKDQRIYRAERRRYSLIYTLRIIELLGAHGEERHLPALRAAARLLEREAMGTAIADAAIARVEARVADQARLR